MVIRTERNYFLIDKKGRGHIRLYNDSNRSRRGILRWQILDSAGNLVSDAEPVHLKVGSGKTKNIAFLFQPQNQSEYKISVKWQVAGNSIEEDIPLFGMLPETGPAPSGELKLRRISEIDCCGNPDENLFVDDGTSRVVDSEIGPYREGGGKRHSRFAYRLFFPKVQVPYLVSVVYPEDKPRTFEINFMIEGANVSVRDAERGIMCGDEYPLDNKFKEHRFFVWPRTNNAALVFMTIQDDHPAAVRSINTFEVAGGRLPKLKIKTPPGKKERWVGIYFEDPTFFKCFGLPEARTRIDYKELPTAVDRLFEYLDYTGQNLLMYPLIFYQGPGFPSSSEPYNAPGYGMWERHPYNFFEYLLHRAEERKINLIAVANCMAVPSLMSLPGPDKNKLGAGEEDTYYNVLSDNSVRFSAFHQGPTCYNLLHPMVSEKTLAYMKDLFDRYSDFKAFKGPALRIHESSCLWMGDLATGYNDFAIKIFERESGLRVPVSGTDPDRFRKRFEWLMGNKGEEWIEWLCKKLSAMYGKLAGHMKKNRRDAVLIFTFVGPWKDRLKVAAGEISYFELLLSR